MDFEKVLAEVEKIFKVKKVEENLICVNDYFSLSFDKNNNLSFSIISNNHKKDVKNVYSGSIKSMAYLKYLLNEYNYIVNNIWDITMSVFSDYDLLLPVTNILDSLNIDYKYSFNSDSILIDKDRDTYVLTITEDNNIIIYIKNKSSVKEYISMADFKEYATMNFIEREEKSTLEQQSEKMLNKLIDDKILTFYYWEKPYGGRGLSLNAEFSNGWVYNIYYAKVTNELMLTAEYKDISIKRSINYTWEGIEPFFSESFILALETIAKE